MVRKTDIVQNTPRPETTGRRPLRSRTASVPFNELLHRRLGDSAEIKFSAHAQQRIQMRNIQITEQDMTRIQDGLALAQAKGAKETLVLLDHVALIVSVKNRTVITAIDQENLQRNVFTNIDSAVIV